MRLRILTVILALSTGCKPTPRTDAPLPLATVAVSPSDVVSPFLCRISVSDLTCVATVDVRFKRGERETQFPRGHQFQWHTPKGSGTGTVWFGCAGSNSCDGYFMFGSNKVTVTAVEPARFWNAAPEGIVPEGSAGIADVVVRNDGFSELHNRWTGSVAMHILKPGPNTTISCSADTCTIGMKQ